MNIYTCMYNRNYHYLYKRKRKYVTVYTEDTGLEFLIDLCIASPFSRQKAIGNAGTASALGSMGAKPNFRCHSLNIGLLYKQ